MKYLHCGICELGLFDGPYATRGIKVTAAEHACLMNYVQRHMEKKEDNIGSNLMGREFATNILIKKESRLWTNYWNVIDRPLAY